MTNTSSAQRNMPKRLKKRTGKYQVYSGVRVPVCKLCKLTFVQHATYIHFIQV